MLNPDTSAPLCEGVDSIFRAEQYALVERISIETTADDVTAKTASALGLAYANPAFTGANAEQLQRAYNQSKDAVGNSSWDAQALLRFSSGVRRTVTLDDSRNYRTSAANDSANAAAIAGAASYDGEGYALDANGVRILLTGVPGDDGNWIAEPFTAGHIVRVSSNSDGYHLRAVSDRNALKADNFSVSDGAMLTDGADIVCYDASGQKTLIADSDTRFVVNDIVNNAWKTYVGVENVPDMNDDPDTSYYQKAAAYIYRQDGLAKLVYVLNAA